MDPLSITASSIAVLSAVTSTGKGIGKLVSLRNAPVELQALSNEAEAFRSLLVIVQSSLRHIKASDIYEEYREALCNLLNNANEAALDLQCKIEYQLKRGVEIDRNGLPKVSRTSWLRSSDEIEKLRRRINNARSDLSTGLQAVNVHLSETTRQMAVQLQSISTVVSTTSTGSLNEPNEPTSGDAGRGEHDVHDATTPADAVAHHGLKPSLETDLKSARHTACSDKSSVRVTTSVTTQRCPPRCPCQCHTRSHIRSSPWFKAIIGQMLFSYHSVIRTTPCDYQPCRENPQKTPQKTEFTYYFPHWLASRALIASSTSGINGPGASISIAMPVVLPDHERIWEAVCNGNIPFLQQLFRQGYTPYVVDEDGRSLVALAVMYDQIRTYKFLIQQGAKVDWRDSSGHSPKATALMSSPIPNFCELGWDFEDAVEDMEFSDLHSALFARSPNTEDFTMLLQREFRSVNAKDRLGKTPLHWAARKETSAAVELLIKWNADVNARDNSQWTPLHDACWSGDAKCIALLMDAETNINAEDTYGRTPIYYVGEADRELVTLLVQNGANLEHRHLHGFTVLHALANWGNVGPINELVRLGADINAITHLGSSPTALAIMRNHTDCMPALFGASKAHGIPIEWKSDKDNSNALHLVALYAGVEIMRLLAKECLTGLDPTQRDNDNDTPNDCFVYSRDRHCTDIREPFEEEEEAWHDLLRSACTQNDIDFESLGISRVSEVDEQDSMDEDSTSDEGGEENEHFVDALELMADGT